MNKEVEKFLESSCEELDEIYKNGMVDTIPRGDTQGIAIAAGEMNTYTKVLAFFAKSLFWQGKIFDLYAPDFKDGILVNKVLPISLTLIVAKVYKDKSWLDGKETIIIDYSKTSFFFRKVRDEIREISPGVFLGKVWWGKKPILYFSLTTVDQKQSEKSSMDIDKKTHSQEA